MTTATADPMPPFMVTFYAHDFGTMTLPLLHELENAGTRLLEGDYGSVLMERSVPAELVDTLKGRTPSEAARFFFMWIMASFDFEAAHWSQVLSLYRTLPSLADVAEGYEDVDTGEPVQSPELEAASALYDQAEAIADALVGSWNLR